MISKQKLFLYLIVFAVTVPIYADLQNLSTMTSATTHRASSYDVTGGNHDNVTVPPGETHVLLDTDGPGCINHIWMTVSAFAEHSTWSRDLVVRMFWENAKVPSVEVPLGDFFALGHGRTYQVLSLPVSVGQNTKALNCYWPMPFKKHARVELVNTGKRSIRRVYHNIDYDLGLVADDQGLFHALYRRDKAVPGQPKEKAEVEDNYVLLETTGRGQYVGCVLNVDSSDKGWWGEGDEVIYIDRQDKPTIFGTGSEDYFCNAWGFHETFSYNYYGVPYMEKLEGGRKLTTAYRWHVADPYRFQKYIKVTMEHMYPTDVCNDYSSVAFWYQDKPITQRPLLPADNMPRFNPPRKNTSGKYNFDGTEIEPFLLSQGVAVKALAVNPGSRVISRGGWLEFPSMDNVVAINLPVQEDGLYELSVRPWFVENKGTLRVGLERDQLKNLTSPAPKKSESVVVGKASSQDKHVTVYLQANGDGAGIDYLVLKKEEEQVK